MTSTLPAPSNVKTGALPSPHGIVDAWGRPIATTFASARMLVGMGTKLDPKQIDLFSYHQTRVQLFQDCVSHATLSLIEVLILIRLYIQLGPEEAEKYRQRLAVAYSYAGAQHLWSPGVFTDTGSSCILTLKWLRDHGVVRDVDYPETQENITQVPPDDLWQKGSGATVTGCHKLTDGPSAPDQICAALSLAEQGIASSCNVVVTADEKMATIGRDGVYDSPGGAILGGHSLAVLGYEPSIGPSGSFAIADTWGQYRWFMTREYVAQHCREMYVSEAAPAGAVQ